MRATKNPWVGINYFDTNSKMSIPPAYWLQRLYDFDADLVVFPSTNMPYAYVLARRARRAGTVADAAIVDSCKQPDTVTCLVNGLVPVSVITRTGTSWSIDNIIQSLKARDIWSNGGPDKVADQYDAIDDKKHAKVKSDIRDDMWNRSGDAWRSYQARTGQRSKLTVPTRTGTAHSASGSTPGSGLVITG